MLHEEMVSPETLELLKLILTDRIMDDFILVGRTALALQVGHQNSSDIDLVSPKGFDSINIASHLGAHYSIDVGGLRNNSLNGRVGRTEVTASLHAEPMIAPLVRRGDFRMASLEDIGAMALHSIAYSGERLKDFVDLYYLLEHRSLNDLVKAYALKYPEKSVGLAKSGILYHRDVDPQVNLGVLARAFNWHDVVSRLKKAVGAPEKVWEMGIREGIERRRSGRKGKGV